MKLKKYLSLLAALVLCFTTLAGIWSAAAEEDSTFSTVFETPPFRDGFTVQAGSRVSCGF